jgi:hypothetical protein
MKQPFKYAVLQYRPSYLLDERVNVGLLFHFVEEKTVEFVFPEHLSRINHLFPGEEPHLLRQYLRSFRNEALGLNKKPLYLNQVDLTTSLLTPDANAFCFSDWKTGYFADRQATLAHYQKLFFKYYGESSTAKPLIKDEDLKRQFSKSLKKQSQKLEIIGLFQEDFVLNHPSISDLKLTFDYGWQNGKTNFVKALSFDLKEKNSVFDKAQRWYGRIAQYPQAAENDKCRFDFLVAPPANQDLNKAFKAAIGILEAIPVANTKIIYGEQLDNYIREAVATVKPLTLFG